MSTGPRTETATLTRNHRLAAQLGISGAAAGFVAGLVQLTIGSRISEWTGAKSSPAALGLLTMAMSLLAGLAALSQRDDDLTTSRRTAYAVVILATGLVCLTTAGWLWWLPAPLLFAAGSFTVDNGRDSLRAIRGSWGRCLLTLLGLSEILMAVSAGPWVMVVGIVGGASLVAAAWVRTTRRATLPALVLLGTVPFAVLGWTAIAPLAVLLAAPAVALPLARGTPGRPVARPVGEG